MITLITLNYDEISYKTDKKAFSCNSRMKAVSVCFVKVQQQQEQRQLLPNSILKRIDDAINYAII